MLRPLLLEQLDSLLEELVFAVLEGEGSMSNDDAAKFKHTVGLKSASHSSHERTLLIDILVETISIDLAVVIRPVLLSLGLLRLLLFRSCLLGGLLLALRLSLWFSLDIIKSDFNLGGLLVVTKCNEYKTRNDSHGETKTDIGGHMLTRRLGQSFKHLVE